MKNSTTPLANLRRDFVRASRAQSNVLPFLALVISCEIPDSPHRIDSDASASGGSRGNDAAVARDGSGGAADNANDASHNDAGGAAGRDGGIDTAGRSGTAGTDGSGGSTGGTAGGTSGGTGGTTGGAAGRGGNSGGTAGTVDAGGAGGNGGGTGGGGGTAGGTGGTAGGTGGTTGGTGGAGGSGGPVDAGPDAPCPTGMKLCNGTCVATTNPATGCAEGACTPCFFPNATSICSATGQCELGTCTGGFDNCKITDPKDGCETDLSKSDTCGSCTNKCGPSAPLCSAMGSSFSCVTGCTAPTSTLCGTECIDVNTNPAHCGDCTTSCMPPTDPNADPTPTCVNKVCGFKCKTSYNLCSGVCSDPSSILTCGPNCQTCAKPANASAATCNGTTCGFTCNAGYEPSGQQCVVAANLYVSTTGSDTNLGALSSPFRTWKRAAQLAQSGTTVNFAAGTYDVGGGDDFTDAIPNGVILQRNGSGTVNFVADGQHSLVFAGSGTVQNIALTHFRSPLSATTGTQTVKGVTITQQVDAVRVGGNAVMVISDRSSIAGAPTENLFLVQLESTAQLTTRDSTLDGTWTNCFLAETGGGILAADSSTLSLANATCSGALSPCVSARGSARVGITNSSLNSLCGGIVTLATVSLTSTGSTFVGMEAREASTWTVSGATVTDTGFGVGLNGTGKITFRGSRFAGINGVGIGALGTFDFGSQSSAGNNTFNTNNRSHGGLNVNLDGVTVEARGNHWLPGVQGADGTGNLPSAYVVGPADGDNFYIVSDQSAIQM